MIISAKHITLSAAILAAAATMTANAEIKRYEVKVNDFKELRVDNNIGVDYYCKPDSAGMVVFWSTPEQTDWLLFDNNGKGRLAVQTDVDYPYGEKLPRLRIYSSGLEKVNNSGDSLVRVYDIPKVETQFKATLIGNGRLVVGHVEAPKVDASIKSGNGQLVISGVTDEAKLSLTGTGTIQADNLKAQRIKATIMGTGDIGCDPAQQLTVQGMGSGHVYYRSKPEVIKSRGVGIKHEPMQ